MRPNFFPQYFYIIENYVAEPIFYDFFKNFVELMLKNSTNNASVVTYQNTQKPIVYGIEKYWPIYTESSLKIFMEVLQFQNTILCQLFSVRTKVSLITRG